MKSSLLIATALAATLVGASALPVFATKNTGSHIDSAEFNKVDGNCGMFEAYYGEMTKRMSEAKTKDAYAKARESANWAINKGFGAGCAWVGGV